MAQVTVLPTKQEPSLPNDKFASGRIAAISSFRFNRVLDAIDVDFCDLSLSLKSTGKFIITIFISFPFSVLLFLIICYFSFLLFFLSSFHHFFLVFYSLLLFLLSLYTLSCDVY